MNTTYCKSILALIFLVCSQNVLAQQTGTFKAWPASLDKNSTHISSEAFSQTFQMETGPINEYVSGRSDTFPVRFQFGTSYDWAMNLKPHDLRSERYRLTTSNGMQSEKRSTITYKGALQNQPESHVRMTISGDYIKAYIFNDQGADYYFEAIDPLDASTDPLFAVYQPAIEPIGACQESKIEALAKNAELSKSSAPYIAEIAMIADRRAFEQANSLETLETELLTTLNYTDAYYAAHQISYQLTEIYVATDQVSQPWPEHNDASEMLLRINEWADNGGLGPHDIGTFWTGNDYGYSYAWSDAVGTYYKQHLVEYQGAGGERWGANLQSHEAGHTWGSPHVGHNQDWIMSPVIYDGELSWNQQVLADFPAYVQKALPHLEESAGLNAWISQISVTGDNDGNDQLDAGETADLQITLSNLGDEPLENLSVRLESTDEATNAVLSINNNDLQVARIEGRDTTVVLHSVSLSVNAVAKSDLKLFYRISDGEQSIEFDRSTQVGTGLPVSTEDAIALNTYTLGQGYPNPFATTTTIPFSIPTSSHVRLQIYDTLGREVETLIDGVLPGGNHQALWDAQDLVNGRYFYRLETQSFSQTRTITVTR